MNPGILVTLTTAEREQATEAGRRRAHSHGNRSEQRVKADALGAIAEMAVAKFFGNDVLEDWLATRAFTEGNVKDIPCDLGVSVQVRSTPFNGGCLAVRPRDPAGHPYVLAVTALVTPTQCRVRIAGWLPGPTIVQNPQWWRNKTTTPRFHDPAWCAPQSALLPIHSLPSESVR